MLPVRCSILSRIIRWLPMKPKTTATEDAHQLAEAVLAGERRALAKALSLLESTRADDLPLQQQLLQLFYPRSGNSWRIGITGAPGAGKSTFIEALGTEAASAGRRIAVLSIDPAGAQSGGSILGDKLRMPTLANHPNAFIRPSSNRGSGSALSLRLRECIIACEAAGYDTIIVETVGAGQSDTAIAEVTDMVILAMLPNAGDEVQGIKRGVIELADLLVVTKCDLDPDAANRAATQLRSALMLIPRRFPDWSPVVIPVSSVHGDGIPHVWKLCTQFFSPSRAETIEPNRRQQRLLWLDRAVLEYVYAATREHTNRSTQMLELRSAVESGRLPPPIAAAELFALSIASKG